MACRNFEVVGFGIWAMAANVNERDVPQLPRGGVMVDDGVERRAAFQRVPAGLRLAVHHHNGLVVGPVQVFDREQFQAQQFDHGPVFGPADRAVAGQAGGFAEAAFDQVSQAQH